MRHIVFNHFKQTRAGCNPFRHIIRQGLTHLGSSGFKIFHIAPTGYVDQMIFTVWIYILVQARSYIAWLGFQKITRFLPRSQSFGFFTLRHFKSINEDNTVLKGFTFFLPLFGICSTTDSDKGSGGSGNQSCFFTDIHMDSSL